MTVRFLENKFRYLEQLLETQQLEEYFNIPDKIKIRVTSNLPERTMNLTISYYSTQEFSKIKGLPFEINCLIHSYLYNKIEIHILIAYPNNYPFVPPIWSFIHVNHNLKTLLDLHEYYKYLIDGHNRKHEKDWSPIIRPCQNILEFIKQINHFEYILSYS